MSDQSRQSVPIEDLLTRARAGDGEAESLLFEKAHARILALAEKRIWDPEAARDIAQETLRTAVEKYRDADLPCGFFPWLFRILHNKVGNYLKRRRVELARFESQDIAFGWAALAVSPDPEIAALEFREVLGKALRRLSPECRRIFGLLLEGAGRQEILDAFPGEPMGTIASRLSRCRAKLLAEVEALHAKVRPPGRSQ
ncbi:MAG: RNA polymerase sigma factor [Candidatus Krumholzibacteriia bacterium]